MSCQIKLLGALLLAFLALFGASTLSNAECVPGSDAQGRPICHQHDPPLHAPDPKPWTRPEPEPEPEPETNSEQAIPDSQIGGPEPAILYLSGDGHAQFAAGLSAGLQMLTGGPDNVQIPPSTAAVVNWMAANQDDEPQSGNEQDSGSDDSSPEEDSGGFIIKPCSVVGC